jgi:DNA polymerase
MICAWAIDDGPVQIVDLTDNAPGLELMAAACHADEIWAHNAEFDRTVLETTSWWPLVELERWRCTAALARMHGLPGGLDKLCQIFKLAPEEAKDAGGKEHIQMFCIPRADGKFNDLHSHPKQWAEFVSYGGQDVTAMRACWRKIPKWNATPRMWDVWHLDQRMNEQGVRMDLQLCQGAVNATTRAKRKLADRTEDMTLGVVESATQRDRLLAYMADFGVDLPDLTADTVERRLEDESLPEHIKELLRIRQQASKASTAKYQRVLNQHIHSRLRNLLVFCGASRTGRWAGRTIQPQNLPRPKHEPWKIAQAIELFRADAIELFEPEDVLGLASSCLRGMIIAADGRTLCAADLVNIEGRKMAWFAGEDWKLEAFARYDRKEGPDLYKVSYARSFNIDPDDIADEGDHRRYLGKVQELALQYCGGVGAFCSMAETYGLRLDQLADAAWPIIPERVKEIAREHWIKACKRRRVYGLDKRVWLTCESLVIMWREAHPAIVKFWYDLEQAVATVVHQPHKVVAVGRVQVDRRGNWLRIKLPSGRYLSYPSPRAGDHDTSFVGINPYTKQWCRISTYSGKLAENIVQASSADLLMDGMLAADAAGFNPVLSVHDEIITEPPDDPKFNDKELSRLMISSSPWAAGLPLAAKGFTAKRYAKK